MNKLFIDLETTGLPKTKGFNDWYDYTDEMRVAINKDLKTRRINV